MCITLADVELIGRMLLPSIRRVVYEEVRAQMVDLLYLEEEVERLKAGRFTEEELQNLCHNQDKGCPLRFAEGCVAYNRKLFGDRSRLYGVNLKEE